MNIPYNYNISEINNVIPKSFKKKNICLTPIVNNKNNIYRKIENHNLTKLKYRQNKQKSINISKKNYYPEENNIMSTYKKLNIFNSELSKKHKIIDNNYSEHQKVFLKNNSIKTIFSNYSHIAESTNTYVSNKTNLNMDKNKNINKNNLIKVDIPNKNYNFHKLTKGPLIEELQSHYYSKNKNNRKKYHNTYDNYNKKTNITIKVGLPLKHLIQEENSKNKSRTKQYIKMNKHTVNKIIDNIFDNTYKNSKNITTDNSLLISKNDTYMKENENPNNIRIKQDDYDSKIEKLQILSNNTLKNNINNNESINKSINMNQIFNKINNPKKFNENDISNSLSTITLTDNYSKSSKIYNNNKNKNKKKNNYKNKENINILKKNKLDIINNYLSNYNSIQNSQNKKNLAQINKNKYKNKMPINIFSCDKLYLSNKVLKNSIINELNNKKLSLDRYKNITHNNLANRYNDILPNKNKLNKLNIISNNNSPSVEDKKIIFSLKDNNDIIKNNNIYNEQINSFECIKYKKKKKDNLNNKNLYEIATNEVNEYYNKEEKYIMDNSKEDEHEEKSDLSFQSLSDSKVLEIANTYIDDHVDRSQVSGILTYKKKKNNNS